MKRTGFLYIAFLIVITSCPVWADLYDYGDATGYIPADPLDRARHVSNGWQQLGDDWDSEAGPLAIDASDDGVSWSTDGGSTFGGDLIRGQDVTFYFDMRRAPYGNHDYDQIKAWIDWDGDLAWHNTNEIIIAEQWLKYDSDSTKSTLYDDTYWKNNGGNIDPLLNTLNPNAILQQTYEVTVTVPVDAVLGDIWLRARVSCDHTRFGPPEDPPYTTPYGKLWQGEVEDYELNVVPVPPGIILAGIGMAVAGWRLKRKESLAN